MSDKRKATQELYKALDEQGLLEPIQQQAYVAGYEHGIKASEEIHTRATYRVIDHYSRYMAQRTEIANIINRIDEAAQNRYGLPKQLFHARLEILSKDLAAASAGIKAICSEIGDVASDALNDVLTVVSDMQDEIGYCLNPDNPANGDNLLKFYRELDSNQAYQELLIKLLSRDRDREASTDVIIDMVNEDILLHGDLSKTNTWRDRSERIFRKLRAIPAKHRTMAQNEAYHKIEYRTGNSRKNYIKQTYNNHA